jgi:hypothetical protein
MKLRVVLVNACLDCMFNKSVYLWIDSVSNPLLLFEIPALFLLDQ